MSIATVISAGGVGGLLGWLMIRWRTRGKRALSLGATLVMIALAAALSAIQFPLGLGAVVGYVLGGAITSQQMAASAHPTGQEPRPGSRPDP